jgi:hypothetical protein
VNMNIYEWVHLVIKMEIIKNRSMIKNYPFLHGVRSSL